MLKRLHIILDLDGTLVDGDKEFVVHPRPHVKEFLDFCFENFASVSIWTAASRYWLYTVLDKIAPGRKFLFMWWGERCTTRPDYSAVFEGEFYAPYKNVKRLKKVWKRYRDLTRDNTLIVDDTPETYEDNYGNAVPIQTYSKEYEKCDKSLKQLQEYLKTLAERDIRSTEKRWWANHIEMQN